MNMILNAKLILFVEDNPEDMKNITNTLESLEEKHLLLLWYHTTINIMLQNFSYLALPDIL